jgi:type IX secretion system PorP/SprF family membrane protein
MNRKLLVTVVIVGAIFSQLHAQQDMIMTHFMYNKMGVNPGATGIEEGICATLIYRNQWDKVNGAPNSVVFNAEANLDRYFNSGLGINFYHDAIGFGRQNNLMLKYSYHLGIANAGVLGMGLGIGFTNLAMAPNWVTPDGNPNDPYLPTKYSGINIDLDFGLYWKGRQDYYVGISSTHLSESDIKNKASNLMSFDTKRHYYIMGGKRFNELFGRSREFDLDLNAIVQTDFVKMSFAVAARVFWKDMIYAGLMYRFSDAVGIMAGVRLDGHNVPGLAKMPGYFSIGYSYDITTNKLSSFSRGSHEAMLKYCYIIPPPPVHKAKNVRWL